MSTWKKLALLNAGWVIGIFISLFLVPPSTPLWLWATVSGLFIAILNYIFFGRQRRAPNRRKNDAMTTAVASVGLLVLLLELIYWYMHY
jgi:uncharacterized membrane protein YfcA